MVTCVRKSGEGVSRDTIVANARPVASMKLSTYRLKSQELFIRLMKVSTEQIASYY